VTLPTIPNDRSGRHSRCVAWLSCRAVVRRSLLVVLASSLELASSGAHAYTYHPDGYCEGSPAFLDVHPLYSHRNRTSIPDNTQAADAYSKAVASWNTATGLPVIASTMFCHADFSFLATIAHPRRLFC
jgi:hypothetical protein